MTNNILKAFTVATFLGVASISSQASTIDLLPVGSANITTGTSATFEIWADFADVGGTIGGGLDIFYDSSILTYNNDFTFAAFGQDNSISRTGDDCSAALVSGCASTGEVNGISPNSFGGMANGLTLMGTLSFTGASVGLSSLTMADNDLPAGGWFDNSTFGSVFPVYNVASVSVSNVPLPASVWLMLSGFGLLAGVVRRK